MAEITRRASALVQLLEDALVGRRPEGNRVPAILVAHGWPNEDAVREQLAGLKRLGNFPVTFDIDESVTRLPFMSTPPSTGAPARPPAPNRTVAPPAAPTRLSLQQTPPPPTRATSTTPPPTFDPETCSIPDLLAHARQHRKAKIQTTGDSLTRRIASLRRALITEAEVEARLTAEAARKEEIARLESQILALRKHNGGATRHRGEFPCDVDGCDKVLNSGQGRAAHKRFVHQLGIKPQDTPIEGADHG